MIKLPPLNALRAFEAAARHSSFSKAGGELCVTHAAVSHQIRQLEEWFGRPLFRRDGRGIRLTKAGEKLSIVISEALESISEASLSLKKQAEEETLVVGCLPSIASRWLVPALPQFSTLYPQYSVQLFYVQAAEPLKDEGYDVIININGDPAAQVDCMELFSQRCVPVASPHYIEKHGPRDCFRKIAESNLLHDASRNDWREWLGRAGLSQHYAEKGHIFEDFNMLATAVIAGHGIALCPVDVFRREIANGDLLELSDLCVRESLHYYLFRSCTSARSVQEFSDWFAGVCRVAKDPPENPLLSSAV